MNTSSQGISCPRARQPTPVWVQACNADVTDHTPQPPIRLGFISTSREMSQGVGHRYGSTHGAEAPVPWLVGAPVQSSRHAPRVLRPWWRHFQWRLQVCVGISGCLPPVWLSGPSRSSVNPLLPSSVETSCSGFGYLPSGAQLI